MFPEPVYKVEVLTSKKDIEKVVSKMHELGCVHVERVEGEYFKNASPLPKLDDLSKKANRLERIIKIADELLVREGQAKRYSERDLNLIEEEWERLRSLKARLAEVKDEIKRWSIFRDLGLTENLSTHRIFVGVFVGDADSPKKVVPKLEAEGLDVTHILKDGSAYYLIIAPEKVKPVDIVRKYGLVPVDMPSKSYEELLNERNFINNDIVNLSHSISERLERILGSVKKDLRSLRTEIDRAQVVTNFGESERLYLIRGWVRQRDLDRFTREMEAFGKRVALLVGKPTHDDNPPVALRNPPALKPYESLLLILSPPRWNEIDPTFIIALTLPIMFGMIVGDIGYSIVLFLLSTLLLSRVKGMIAQVMRIIQFSSIWGVLWGLVFGEVFGYEIEFQVLGVSFPLIVRMHEVMNLLILTVIFGAIHIALGNLFGAINAFVEKDMKHLVAKVGWLLFEVGIFVLALFDANVGAALVLLGAVAIVANEGIVGVIEMPSLLGNILSYTRIGAVGLSGVLLAMLINMLAPRPEMGLAGVILAIVYIVFHLFAMGIAAFESLIQGGRLHAVEMFSKFYHGGGVMFNPFRIKEV